MEENRENQEIQKESGWESGLSGINRWLVIGAVALLIAAGVAFGYGYRQQLTVGHLTAQQSVATATIDQLQNQLNNVNAKLNDMAAAQQAAAQEAEQKKARAAAAAKQGAPVDKRYKQLQAQLEDQEKQLKDTQDLWRKTGQSSRRASVRRRTSSTGLSLKRMTTWWCCNGAASATISNST